MIFLEITGDRANREALEQWEYRYVEWYLRSVYTGLVGYAKDIITLICPSILNGLDVLLVLCSRTFRLVEIIPLSKIAQATLDSVS